MILATIGRVASRGNQIVVIATDPETLDVLVAEDVDEVVPVVASLDEAGRWLAIPAITSDEL